jgi:predicted transcriptional regulator
MKPREIDDYLEGAKSPGAIVLEDVREIRPVTRASLYGMWPGFKVPQSFRYVPASWVERMEALC